VKRRAAAESADATVCFCTALCKGVASVHGFSLPDTSGQCGAGCVPASGEFVGQYNRCLKPRAKLNIILLQDGAGAGVDMVVCHQGTGYKAAELV